MGQIIGHKTLKPSRLLKISGSIALTTFLLLLMPAAKLPKKTINQVKTIVLDAGHGGSDPGCNGANEIWEKEVTLDVVLKVGKLITEQLPDVKVLYTRTTDKALKLSDRPNYANKQDADLFISVHCNANNDSRAKGSETYFMGLHKEEGNLNVAKRENSAITFETDYQNNDLYGGFDPNSPESHIIFSLVQNAYLNQSLRLSSYVEEETSKLTSIRSRGVKQAGFLVLWKTSMPSILIETGFLTNQDDRNYLKTEEGQWNVANGILNAVVRYKKHIEKK